jgi:hypothetical protein
MQVFPSTKRARVNLLVFPFKAYIVVTLPIVVAFQGSTSAALFLAGYGLCAVPLLLGLIVQFFASTRASAANTLIFLIPSAVIFSMFWLKQIEDRHLVEREKWKTQTCEMGFDEVVNRFKEMEQRSGGKWRWDQKQEDKPSPGIQRAYHFAMNEHKSDGDLVFQVFVAAFQTNRTTVSEQTVKFGLHDTVLNQEELVAQTNRITEVIQAIRGRTQRNN